MLIKNNIFVKNEKYLVISYSVCINNNGVRCFIVARLTGTSVFNDKQLL